MYLQEWLSIPVCSLLGINLVGNHKMVEVVDPPESILLFSSFSSLEFFWVRLVLCYSDMQVTVLPLEGGEAHHVWVESHPSQPCWQPCRHLPLGLQMSPQLQEWGCFPLAHTGSSADEVS